MIDELSSSERTILLELARKTIVNACEGEALPQIVLDDYSSPLRAMGASFVTLTKRNELRGCVGALEAYQPLIEDVREHAYAAAFNDYRFPEVKVHELPLLEIEISRLTQPQPVRYVNADDLIGQLRPNIDGVIIKNGMQRATFLPQVWEKLPDPSDFLNHLCQKMGATPGLWQHKKIEVLTYQVEMFHE